MATGYYEATHVGMTRLEMESGRALIDSICPQLAAYDDYFKRGIKPPPSACVYHGFVTFHCERGLLDYRHRTCPGPAECGEGHLFIS